MSVFVGVVFVIFSLCLSFFGLLVCFLRFFSIIGTSQVFGCLPRKTDLTYA